jgi:AbrB family looped-hinge helix DNA binding protein
MSETNIGPHIYGTVKVGDRGQIVIPADARKELKINPGDLLLVMAGRNRRGLGIIKADAMREIADRILKGIETEKQEL